MLAVDGGGNANHLKTGVLTIHSLASCRTGPWHARGLQTTGSGVEKIPPVAGFQKADKFVPGEVIVSGHAWKDG